MSLLDFTTAEDAGPGGAGELRVLVVEDHADTLKYLLLFLEQLGHQVYAARTMEAALQLLSGQEIDFLLTDIGLTDGSGWDLVEQAQLPPELFRVSMSGFGMDSEIAKSAALAFRHHLRKPFLPRELEALLETASAELRARE